MRFSDFDEINDLLEVEYLVGYFGINNVRISAANLFGSQLLGSGSAGFIPVFSDEKDLESSIIYIDGSNVSIGTTVDTGYKLFVDSGSLADGLYVTSQKTGLKIESTGLNENIVVLSGQEGDVFVIPTNTGAAVVSLRKIVHPDATDSFESATLGQVNSNIETTAQELQGEINLRVAYEDVGVPLGVAELDANGKIIISQIPDSILGQVSYQGVWNVATNTPTLEIPPASTTKGDYYIVSGVGTFSGIDFQDGDWIISKGDRWEKVDNTDAVVSVFGRIGAIQAVESDYQAFYPKLSESYVNPTFISSLDWSKITNSPNFLLENQTVTLSGDVTGSGKTSILTSISTNAVTNEKIRQSAGLSIIGRSVSTSGNVSDITATQEGHVLRRSNGSLSFGLLTDVSISDLSWNKITGTPTTILGYGITDAYTKIETDNIVAGYVPYTGATANVNLGLFGIIANQFSVPGGSANQFLKANGSLDATSYTPVTRNITAGDGLVGGGNLSADRIISHADTSTAANLVSNNTNGVVIQSLSVALDTYGHVTDRSVGTVNLDSRYFTQAQINSSLSAYQLVSEKGQANGYAQLDTGAKLPISIIPDSVLGQVEYQGTWNATTNTPTLPITPIKKGDYYVVNTAGIFVSISFEVGDWIISNGSQWEKVDNTDAVSTVFGRLGNILALGTDYNLFYVRHDINNQGLNNTQKGNARTNINAEPTFTKNTGFNKNFGAVANTVTQGNDVRLSDARVPLAHTHGNITNAGAIGSVANQVAVTGTNGVLTTASRSGIDTRASFPPSEHNHDERYYTETELDNGQLDNRYFTEAESNLNFEPKNANIQTHILATDNPHGVTKSQVGLGSVDNTSDVNKPISAATQTALNNKKDNFAENTGFNKNFGTVAGSVAQGNDSRFHAALTLATPLNGLGLTDQQLSLALASTSATGALSSTDWNNFNTAFIRGNFRDFGLGTDEISSGNVAVDIDTTYVTGFYRIINATTGTRPAGLSSASIAKMVVQNWGVANGNRYISQTYYFTGNNRVFQRSMNANVWSEWREIWHSGNLSSPIQGTGASGHVSFWTGAGTLSGDGRFFINNNIVNIRGNSTSFPLKIGDFLEFYSASNTGVIRNTSTDGVIQISGGTLSNGGNIVLRGSTSGDNIDFRNSGTIRWSMLSNGIFQSNGAQTIRTSTGALTLATAGNNGNILLRPNGTGRVGIGTTAPASILDVKSFIQIDTYEAGTTVANTSGFLRILSGNKTGWAPNDELGKIEFFGTDTSGIGTRNLASIRAINSQGNGTTTTVSNGELAFYTSNVNALETLKWTIRDTGIFQSNGAQTIQTSTGNLTLATAGGNGNILLSPNGSGNVGIGTTNPATVLDINSGLSGSQSGIRLRNTVNTGNFAIALSDNNLLSIYDVTQSATPRININGVNGDMTVLGKVGIGTTTPSEKLDVDGSVRIRTISNALGDYATLSGTGVVTKRTPAQVLTDIGASSINLSNAWETGIVNNQTGFNSSASEVPVTGTHFGFLSTLVGNNSFGGAFVMRNNRSFFQTRESGTLQGWKEYWHSGNLINPVKGTGAAGRVAFWTGTGTQSSDGGLVWDNTNKLLILNKIQINTNVGGYLEFGLNGVNTPFTNSNDSYIFSGEGSVGTFLAGSLNLQSRSNTVARDINFITGLTPTLRWSILGTGIFQSNGAQTIQTSTGNLTLATGGGNGNILLSPNGTGNVGIGTTTPIGKLHVNGDNQGTIILQGTLGSYAENIRLPEASNGFTTIHMGGTATATGTAINQWSIHKASSALSHRFQIRHSNDAYLEISTAGVISGNGSGLTSLNGSNITTGTVADARIATTLVRTSRTLTGGDGILIAGVSTAQNLSANRTITVDSTVVRTSGNQTIAGVKTFSSTITGSITGNALTATTLQTSRLIGGVSFNGSANINLPGVNTAGNQNTTGSAATLTTARTLTIGNTGKTFNGGANVSWSLAEIGALRLSSGATIDVNAANGTTLFAGSTGSWSNRGPSGNNAGALFSINTHPGNYYSQLWFDTAGNGIYHRTANNTLPTASWNRLVTNSGTWGINITGNAGTATTFSTDRSTYKGVTDNAVIGQLMWKHYGNNHTIFDASNSTTPSGTACNNANSQVAWTGTYPTLMGWNGASTYGVRVDSARVADNTTGNALTATRLQTARTINGVSFNGSANITLRQFFGTGNDYNTAGIEVVGNGSTNTVFPSVGFHQPGLYASSIQLRSGSNFHFIAQGGTTLANAHATTFFGALSGNATTATTLQTARTINGTSFNGSANITTANWGAARTLTIGNTGKSVNGSINVAWSLAEIGAAANTITLSGGDGITTTIGNLTANRSISVDSTVVRTSGNQTIGGSKIFTNNTLFDDLIYRRFSTGTAASNHFRKYTDIIHYVNGNSTVSGDLRIEIPVTTSTMWSMEVVIVEYDGAASTNIKTTNVKLTGYTTTNANTSVLTDNPNRITQVRFGRNIAGNRTVILIRPNSTFRYPKAYIKEVNTHHSNETTFGNSANYAITVTTDETDFTLNNTIVNNNFLRDSSLVNTFGAQTIAGVKTFSSTITGSITGNALTATRLQTARTINGTSFNGSANITTANWGTARTLTIGNTGKSVNGSINVAWSLAEIGAQPAGSYLTDAGFYNHRTYTRADNFLGGYYVGGGTEKPNNTIFGAGKLKVAMLSGSNLGFGGIWNDVLWLSTYTGGDVKSSLALVSSKYSDDVFISKQNFDSSTWGAGRLLLTNNNFNNFTPNLTGSGASGTWGINITGNAGSVGSVPLSGLTRATVFADASGDFNSMIGFSGVSSINATVNTPFGSAWYLLYNARHRGGTGDGNAWGSQIAIGMTNYSNRIAIRTQTNTTWQPWVELVPTSRTLTGGDGILIAGVSTAQNLSANRTITVDSTVVRTSGNQTIAGVKTFSSTITGSITGNAGTATSLSNDSGFFRNRANIANEAALDTTTFTGFATVPYTGFSKMLWQANNGGSVGTIQQEFDYSVASRGWRIRNKTDNTTWTPWGYVAMTTANQGHISGNLWHTGNLASPIQGTGGTGRVPIWTGFGTQTSSVNFTYNTSSNRMGVGIVTPTLNSSGSAIHIHAPTAGHWSMLHTTTTSTGSGAAQGTIFGVIGVDSYIYNYSAGHILLATSSVERMRITSNGNVLIGGNVSASTSWRGTSVHGINGADKVIVGNLASTTNGAIIGGHVSALNAWANLNIAGINLIFRSNGETERMRINSGGSLGLGLIPTTLTAGRFEASNDIVAFASSDIRWKNNIKEISNSVEKLSNLRGVSFDWLEDEPIHGNKGHDYGVIAQEVENLFPEMVQTRESGMKAVKYDRLIPVMIEAIKELSKKITTLESKLN